MQKCLYSYLIKQSKLATFLYAHAWMFFIVLNPRFILKQCIACLLIQHYFFFKLDCYEKYKEKNGFFYHPYRTSCSSQWLIWMKIQWKEL